MKAHHIPIQKTARYFSEGELHKDTREVWIVCHGYGQLAEYFLRKFQFLASEERVIIAPEGLHRYYLNGSSGRVGASWMTKEDRLTDINDYVRFLDQIYASVKSEAPQAKIVVLGFSQGCATVSRWLSFGEVLCDKLILYAGVFPPDLDFELDGSKLKNVPVIIANGDQDEFLQEKDIHHQLEVLKRHHIYPKYLPFKGTHQIYTEVLVEIARI
jgi:predicted esterase